MSLIKFTTVAIVLLALVYGSSAGPCAPDCESAPVGSYFPHPRNCRVFFQCSNGQAIRQKCPRKLHFNPTLNVCDYPNRAGCEASRDFHCKSDKEDAIANAQAPEAPGSKTAA